MPMIKRLFLVVEAVFIVVGGFPSYAFVPGLRSSRGYYDVVKKECMVFQMQKTDKNMRLCLNSNGMDEGEGVKEKLKYSTARAGGRVKRSRNTIGLKNTGETKESNRNGLVNAGIGFVILFLILKTLGSFFFSEYVYFESSVYQTTTRTEDGRVETKSKKRIKTNIPSLRDSGDIEDIDRSIRLEQDQIEREMNYFMRDFLERSYDIDN